MRRVSFVLPLFALLALCGVCRPCAAEGDGDGSKKPEFVDSRNPDTFERTYMPLPDGSKIEYVSFGGRRWRVVKQEIMHDRIVERQGLEVCFEAKFATFGDDEVKLYKQRQGTVTVTDPRAKAYIKDHLKINDNVWLCGTLRTNPRNNRELELILVDIIKRDNDLRLFNAKVARLVKAGDMDGLKKVGNEIKEHLKTAIVPLNEQDEYVILQNKAWDTYLELKEKTVAINDADACFDLASEYLELRSRTNKRNDWIRKCLRIDPDHPRASVIASNELDMIKHKGLWITKEDFQRIKAQEEREKERLEQESQAQAAKLANLRRDAEKERLKRLTELQRALRTRDGKQLEAALRALGEAVQKSPDPEFGRKGIAILANINDPYAIWPGLDFAAKSELGEVRLDAYQALAWRGNEQALRALSDALLRETDAGTAKGGVKALVVRGGRPAVQALMDCLRSEDAKVVAEVLEGLRLITRENMSAKNEWLRWWDENKTRKSLPFDKPEDAKVQ